MARFKENAHDVYEKKADFIYEKTLTKTVGKPSTHTHKSDLSWTSDEKITVKSPEIEEIYKTVNRYYNISIYLYLLKTLVTPRNFSDYIYSKNKSWHYRNYSGATTNTGLIFILPGPRLEYYGLRQRAFSLLNKEVTVMNEKKKEGKAKETRFFYVEDSVSIDKW